MNIVEIEKEHLDVLIAELKEYDEFWNEKILIDEFQNENSEYFVLIDREKLLDLQAYGLILMKHIL